VPEGQGRRRKQLLEDLKDKTLYWKIKEESLDCTPWRKTNGRIEVSERQGRRRKQLLEDLKVKTLYCKLKEELLDCTL
jgi:hypothetical protein